VHRDVKPGNVIVAAGGAKLVDFGIAAAIGSADKADEDGVMLGTPAYLAPERLEEGVVVPGSDVYALGLLLYRMLAGTTPWSAYTTTGMLQAHAYLPPRPLPAVDVVPAEVAALCERCLAKDPVDRPSAAEVATALSSAVGLSGVAGLSGAAGLSSAAPSPRPAAPDTIARVAEPKGAVVDAGHTGTGRHADRARDGGRARRRRLSVLAAVVAVLVAGLFLALPRLFGSPSGPSGSADPQPGMGGIAVPGVPSFPAPGDGSGTPTGGPGGPGGGGSVADPAGTQDASGAGAGVGAPGRPGGPPAGTAAGTATGAAGGPAGDRKSVV